jgi:hypothetical protein
LQVDGITHDDLLIIDTFLVSGRRFLKQLPKSSVSKIQKGLFVEVSIGGVPKGRVWAKKIAARILRRQSRYYDTIGEKRQTSRNFNKNSYLH